MNVNWGKHAGTDLIELTKKHPAYAVWYANKCMVGKYRDDYTVISELLDCTATWLNFGKWKNHTVADAVSNDIKYCEWMLKSDWVQNNHPNVIKAIKEEFAKRILTTKE